MADTRYASRKFLLTCAAFVAGVAWYAIGYMSADQWIGFTQWTLGLYLAANVGDEVASKA